MHAIEVKCAFQPETLNPGYSFLRTDRLFVPLQYLIDNGLLSRRGRRCGMRFSCRPETSTGQLCCYYNRRQQRQKQGEFHAHLLLSSASTTAGRGDVDLTCAFVDLIDVDRLLHCKMIPALG